MTVVFILSEGLIFISGERLALFFMNLSAVYIILLLKEYRTYRFWTYLVSLSLIFALFVFVPNSKQRFIDQTIKDVTRNTDDKVYIFSKPHNDMYITAYRIFLDNKLFGVGPRQYRNTCDDYAVSIYSCETHPHNTYLELLSEAGIFAFLIVTSFFILLCFVSIKHFIFKFIHGKKSVINDLEVCLFSAVIISLWPFSPSGSFFNNWMSIVYYFPIGLMLWQRSKYKSSIKSE